VSNRARRAHTHALRRRLLPPTEPLVTIRLQLFGARRQREQLDRVQKVLRDG